MSKTATVAICSHNKNILLLNTIKECQKLRSRDILLFVIQSGEEEPLFDKSLVDFYYFDRNMISLSAKKNFAISRCTTGYIIFTDDDCIPDDSWVNNILRGFEISPDVKCVTGRIKQSSDKEEGGVNKRFDYDKVGDKPRLVKFSPFRIINIMKIGTGGNMSFPVDVFDEIGKFDESLGTGTQSYAGEDKDILYRVLKSGYSIYYEPKALIYHRDIINKNNLPWLAYRYSYGTQRVLKKHNDFRCQLLYVLGLCKYLLEYAVSVFHKDERSIAFNLLKGFLGIKTNTPTTKIDVCNVKIDNVTFQEALEKIFSFIEKMDNVYVVTPNIDHIVRIERDASFREIYNKAALVLADGMPVIWASRFLGAPLKEKISGSDLFPQLCARAAERGYKLFFLGGRNNAALIASEVLKNRYPSIRIVGTYSPPFGFENDEKEDAKITEMIKASKPDILFVGLGSPKQENWIYKHCKYLNIPVSIGIGGTFEFASGMVKRAPLWMQKMGLEWFWRLVIEPKRLWRRYILEDTSFFWLLLKAKFKPRRLRLFCR